MRASTARGDGAESLARVYRETDRSRGLFNWSRCSPAGPLALLRLWSVKEFPLILLIIVASADRRPGEAVASGYQSSATPLMASARTRPLRLLLLIIYVTLFAGFWPDQRPLCARSSTSCRMVCFGESFRPRAETSTAMLATGDINNAAQAKWSARTRPSGRLEDLSASGNCVHRRPSYANVRALARLLLLACESALRRASVAPKHQPGPKWAR